MPSTPTLMRQTVTYVVSLEVTTTQDNASNAVKSFTTFTVRSVLTG